MRISAKFLFSTVALTVSAFAPRAGAATIINQTYTGSFPAVISGTLPNQATVLEESFTVANTGTLTAFTTSYANGGFQPNLTLFNSSGIAIANQWATPPAGAKADPTTGLTLDSNLTAANLTPGTYTLTLTDWALNQSATATSLSDGFTSNFGNGVTFVDAQGNTRTGAYLVNVNLSGGASSTPEPATALLLVPASLLGWALRKRLASVR